MTALAISGASHQAHADVTWTLSGLTFADGGTAAGSFVTDDTGTLTSFDITTTARAACYVLERSTVRLEALFSPTIPPILKSAPDDGEGKPAPGCSIGGFFDRQQPRPGVVRDQRASPVSRIRRRPCGGREPGQRRSKQRRSPRPNRCRRCYSGLGFWVWRPPAPAATVNRTFRSGARPSSHHG